jgi:2-phosphosulfolactate phosphatase
MKNSEFKKQMQVTIVIDAFRAFATATYILNKNPAKYILTSKSSVITRLAADMDNTLLIGKAEIGSDLKYDIPNSPTRVLEVTIEGHNILHRTAAGAKGILLVHKSDVVLAAGFINAEATAEYVKKMNNVNITIMPMGHEASEPSLEDDICAKYIKALIEEEKLDIKEDLKALRDGPGQYFFQHDQWQYPQEDFERCIELGGCNFAIKADIYDDYAVLSRCQ